MKTNWLQPETGLDTNGNGKFRYYQAQVFPSVSVTVFNKKAFVVSGNGVEAVNAL